MTQRHYIKRHPVHAAGFTMAYHAMTVDTKLSHIALRLYLLLDMASAGSISTPISTADLEMLLDVGRTTVFRALENLEERKYILRRSRGQRREIVILDPIYAEDAANLAQFVMDFRRGSHKLSTADGTQTAQLSTTDGTQISPKSVRGDEGKSKKSIPLEVKTLSTLILPDGSDDDLEYVPLGEENTVKHKPTALEEVITRACNARHLSPQMRRKLNNTQPFEKGGEIHQTPSLEDWFKADSDAVKREVNLYVAQIQQHRDDPKARPSRSQLISRLKNIQKVRFTGERSDEPSTQPVDTSKWEADPDIDTITGGDEGMDLPPLPDYS